MRAASADLATTSSAADAALSDVRAADEGKINGTSLQKSESVFLVFLKHTLLAGTNQRMKISWLIFCNLCETKKIKLKNS